LIFAIAGPILVFTLPSIDFQGPVRQRDIEAVWTDWCVSFFMAITYGGKSTSHSVIILWLFVIILVIVSS
jgi:hypothetical protein